MYVSMMGACSLCFAEGEWIACDDVYVGEKGAKDFMETKDFLIDGAAPMTIVTRLAIKIKGEAQ